MQRIILPTDPILGPLFAGLHILDLFGIQVPGILGGAATSEISPTVVSAGFTLVAPPLGYQWIIGLDLGITGGTGTEALHLAVVDVAENTIASGVPIPSLNPVGWITGPLGIIPIPNDVFLSAGYISAAVVAWVDLAVPPVQWRNITGQAKLLKI